MAGVAESSPYRQYLMDMIVALDGAVSLSEPNQVLLVLQLDTEEKIIKFNEWIKTRLKGENEIDLACDNEFTGELVFFEVKRDASRISLGDLERKSRAFLAKNPELQSRKISFKGLSLQDM